MADEDYSTMPRSAKAAKITGDLFYFTGKPCARGHIAKRYTTGNGCKDCSLVNAKSTRDSKRKPKVLSIQKTAEMNREKFYFTGVPCAHGHICNRRTNNFACVECENEHAKNFRFSNLEKCRQKERDAYAADPQKFRDKNNRKNAANRKEVNAKARVKNAANREASRLSCRIWYEENKESRAEYRKQNQARYTAHAATRRAREMQATPAWADFEKITLIYLEAEIKSKETGVKYSVDHVVPLAGRNVCGLHVHTNMMVIPLLENVSKGNRFNSDDLPPYIERPTLVIDADGFASIKFEE